LGVGAMDMATLHLMSDLPREVRTGTIEDG
jgi:hypothetical protein